MGSSGLIPENMEVKICDDEGIELPLGEKGEIVIRGENVMKGYWKNEETTAETIKDGWLCTGDMGYMDPYDFLHVLGRYKSLLIADDRENTVRKELKSQLPTSLNIFIRHCFTTTSRLPYTLLFNTDKKLLPA